MLFTVEEEIFKHFSGLKIVVAIARNIAPSGEAVRSIRDSLEEAWASAGASCKAHGNAQSHPRVVPWVERMKAVGAPRKLYPSSIESLLRRAGKGGDPVSISPAVDFYNAISLRNIVPAGGYDTDDLREHLALRISKDGDTFRSFDEEEDAPVPPGEISYADGSVIVTRQFVWRQSRHAMIRGDSRNVLFLSEVLGELGEAAVHSVRDSFAEGVERCFGVTPRVVVIDEGNREIE